MKRRSFWKATFRASAYLGIAAVTLGNSSCLFNTNYTVGGAVTGLHGAGLVVANNGSDNVSFTGSGNFTFSRGTTNNTAYSVTVVTQPSNPAQTCTVRNGSGTINRAGVTNVIVNCVQAGRFAYVANQTADTISAFVIDPAGTGILTPIAGSAFASEGNSPVTAIVDPNGAFLYVVNNASNNVSLFAIDYFSGALTPAGVPIATGGGPIGIAINPTNRFLYVANSNDGSISAFQLSPGTGLATAISGSPFTIGGEPFQLTIDPNGNFLYVTDFSGSRVTALAIDSITGVLYTVSGSPFSAGTGAGAIAVDPTDAFAYVANVSAASISEYTLNPSGALTASGPALATGSGPQALAVDRVTGNFLYVANVPSNNAIATYRITPAGSTAGAGALTVASTASGTGNSPQSLAVDPLGGFIYTANQGSNDVSVYSVDASGVLTALGSPFLAGAGARSIAID